MLFFSFIWEETSEFYSKACFVIFKLNLLLKLKKLKDLKMGQDITKYKLLFFYFIWEETSEFYSRACFVIFKLNLLLKLKKLKDLKVGQDITK